VAIPVARAPALAIVVCGTLPPPWFVAIEAPACGCERRVRAEATIDKVDRSFVCDLPAGHREARHRQVTDNEAGLAITWPVSAGGDGGAGGVLVSSRDPDDWCCTGPPV
jgi:hypothetical protein